MLKEKNVHWGGGGLHTNLTPGWILMSRVHTPLWEQKKIQIKIIQSIKLDSSHKFRDMLWIAYEKK